MVYHRLSGSLAQPSAERYQHSPIQPLSLQLQT